MPFHTGQIPPYNQLKVGGLWTVFLGLRGQAVQSSGNLVNWKSLPELVNIATVYSGVRSDLTAQLKPPGQKKTILKISEKLVEKQRKRAQISPMAFSSICSLKFFEIFFIESYYIYHV
jgi:hypothetical protein